MVIQLAACGCYASRSGVRCAFAIADKLEILLGACPFRTLLVLHRLKEGNKDSFHLIQGHYHPQMSDARLVGMSKRISLPNVEKAKPRESLPPVPQVILAVIVQSIKQSLRSRACLSYVDNTLLRNALTLIEDVYAALIAKVHVDRFSLVVPAKMSLALAPATTRAPSDSIAFPEEAVVLDDSRCHDRHTLSDA
jgi:hypothetical protein